MLSYDDEIVPLATEQNTTAGADQLTIRDNLRCKFHPGRYDRGMWTCCNRPANPYNKPCYAMPEHEPRTYAPGELEARWQYTPTPSMNPRNAKNGKASPPDSNVAPAVAIDCEMGTAFDGESELIRVSVIDYFSGAVLLDRLVYPSVRMQHYNTRYSGVKKGDMERARRNKECLFGIAQAQREVWKFVGPNTIVVGHSAQNDLAALRWIHTKVVDSYLIEHELRKKDAATAEAEKKGTDAAAVDATEKKKKGGFSLKHLALEKLGRCIQQGKPGHDSIEDAAAARDLVDHRVRVLMADIA